MSSPHLHSWVEVDAKNGLVKTTEGQGSLAIYSLCKQWKEVMAERYSKGVYATRIIQSVMFNNQWSFAILADCMGLSKSFLVDCANGMREMSTKDVKRLRALANNSWGDWKVPKNNYGYTVIGELERDDEHPVTEWSRSERSRSERIEWRVDSKISRIVRTAGSEKKSLEFEYDAC